MPHLLVYGFYTPSGQGPRIPARAGLAAGRLTTCILCSEAFGDGYMVDLGRMENMGSLQNLHGLA